MDTEKDPAEIGTPALWRLLRRVGTDTIRAHRASDDGTLTLSTPDPSNAVRALLGVLLDRESDEDLCVQAALLLGQGEDLAPLALVLRELGPMLTNHQSMGPRYAAMVLEVAAPAPGNEDLTKEPSIPTESLRRIAASHPELQDLVGEIVGKYFGNQDGP